MSTLPTFPINAFVSIRKLLSCLVIAVAFQSLAQDDVQKKRAVDASNPTNLYTQINTLFEYTHLDDGNSLYGMRANVQYTFNPDNLILAEVPLLYNEGRGSFGLSDVRLRYFSVVKRTMTAEKFEVIAPFMDVTLPTGSFEDGLGTSSFVLSAGSVYGFALSKKVLMFPG